MTENEINTAQTVGKVVNFLNQNSPSEFTAQEIQTSLNLRDDLTETMVFLQNFKLVRFHNSNAYNGYKAL